MPLFLVLIILVENQLIYPHKKITYLLYKYNKIYKNFFHMLGALTLLMSILMI